MRPNPDFDIEQVRATYDGIQSRLYELLMGQQLHIGGYASTMELADAAAITAGQRGIELCCGTGASMLVLVKLRDVASMTGVELAPQQVERGRRSAHEAGVDDRITFVVGDATSTGLPDHDADFVWGEDAWCYVPDKEALIGEAARLLRPGGVIAFTDWVEGPAGLPEEEADRIMQAMSFPGFQSIDGYRSLLSSHGFDVAVAEDTTRFGPSFASYAQRIREQTAFDVLSMFEFDTDVVQLVASELEGLSGLGSEGKLIQGRFVARRTG